MLLTLIEQGLPWVFLLLLLVALIQQWVIHRWSKELDDLRRSREYYYHEYRKIRGTQTIYNHIHDLPLVADSNEESQTNDTF